MGAHPYSIYIHIKDQLYPHLFLEILHRYCRLVILGIWHAWSPTLKMIELTCMKIRCLCACKNQFHPSLPSWGFMLQQILQSDWSIAFWPISQKKIMIFFFKKLKKNLFWAILQTFSQNCQKLASVKHILT